MRAANSVGSSGWSDSANAAPEDKPAQPAAPTLTYGDQSLDVSWTAPADNGQAISGYGVQYRACTATDSDTTVLTCATNPTWGAWTDRSGETNSDTATSATVTGLTNGTAYQVRVRASNSVGDSAWSDESTRKTPTAQKPDAPTAPTLSYSDQSLGCVVDGACRQRSFYQRLRRAVPGLHCYTVDVRQQSDLGELDGSVR